MRRRVLLFSGLAFVAGLFLGALLFARFPTSFFPAGEDGDGMPRLAPGATLEVHNLGRQVREVRIELRDAKGALGFEDGASLEGQESLRRSLVNLVEGTYRVHLFVGGVEQAVEGFQTGGCASGTQVVFSVSDGSQGGVVVRSAASCR